MSYVITFADTTETLTLHEGDGVSVFVNTKDPSLVSTRLFTVGESDMELYELLVSKPVMFCIIDDAPILRLYRSVYIRTWDLVLSS
ncbi:hypothetical protein D6Q47_22735 [Salmonella enterica subsp. enterica serovar Stanley]|nr:hypothetical protein [Salmonella enterica subsp. enterica serovar Stanley]